MKDVRGIEVKVGQDVLYTKSAYGYGVITHFGKVLEVQDETWTLTKILGDKGKTILRNVTTEIVVLPPLTK